VIDLVGEDRQLEPRRRLHPLTPLLRGAKILAVAVAAISWQGYAQLGFGRWLVLMAAVMVGAVGLSAISWLVTGFHVVGKELRIYEGLLWRRTRAIPLERIQAIDVVRPLLARLVGLAELRIEVIGASKTEAPLAFVSLPEAVRLRERLIGLAAGAPTAGPSSTFAPEPARKPEPTLIHTVDNRHVLIAQLLTGPVLFVPFALALTAMSLVFNPPTWSVIGVASAITALVGVVLPPLRRTLAEWDFRIAVDDAGLRLSHGLLETRNQTVPPQRVQAVGVVAPLLWRPLGWLRVRLDVAGYGEQAREGVRTGVLLPVADRPTTRHVVAQVLGGVDVDTLLWQPAPGRARWLAPLEWPALAVAVTDDIVGSREGWLTRRVVVALLARVQSVRVVQGPLQRWLGLASVHVDTAGALHAVGRHRTRAEAYALAETLSRLSRSARLRAARLAATQRPGGRDHGGNDLANRLPDHQIGHDVVRSGLAVHDDDPGGDGTRHINEAGGRLHGK
jgi:putative membrane protein